MTNTTDYLLSLSDAELLEWWGLFGTYPTADRKQRERLDGLRTRAIEPAGLYGAYKPPRLATAAVLMPWQKQSPEPVRKGLKLPVESDRGEWWPTATALAADLKCHPGSVGRACVGKHRIKGRTLRWSLHKKRPNLARSVA